MSAPLEFTAGDELEADLTDVDLHADTVEARRQEAAANAARFQAFLRGADERVKHLPREGIRGKAMAVANLMASNVLTGRIQPKNAKEAADVAKIFYDIGRREVGDEDVPVSIGSPEQRAAAITELTGLVAEVRARAVQQGLTAPPLEVVDAELVDEDEIVAGELAGVPTRSPTVGASLARVRGD